MSKPTTETGRQLYDLLPEVYRTRDGERPEHGDRRDLAAYLDACGELLDRIRNTLDQRLADAFPEGEHAGRAAQSWLLPYFARLLDVQLRSPHVDGRRAEVANAVAWRQRKGTPASIEAIAEAVGQLEAEVHEGWQRVAATPRVDMPRLPAAAFGLAQAPDPANPLEAATHPALPSVTPVFGRSGRAIETESRHPLARRTRFPGGPVYWRQSDPRAMPCFPGSFQDPTRRTVDLRSPGWDRGHFHPRRVLLFVPPPTGFFTFDSIDLIWGDRAEEVDDAREAGIRTIAPRPAEDGSLPSVTITTSPTPFNDEVVRISDLVVNGTIRFFGAGRLELERVAARTVLVQTAGTAEPVLDARDCLFQDLEAPQGLVRLEACTVTGQALAARMQASDCILPRRLSAGAEGGPSCIRYSRLPAAALETPAAELQRAEVTTLEPVFYDFQVCTAGGTATAADWGVPGHAVLHPATPEILCTGAEDGGEMGAYHHRMHCLQAAAVLDKLEEYVPVGLETALIPDPSLLSPPPTTG